MNEFNMDYDSIPERTIPQIEAIIGSRSNEDGTNNEEYNSEEHTIDDAMAFVNLFNGF